MATINFGMEISSTSTRFKKDLMKAASHLADIDYISLSEVKLDRGDSQSLVPTKLIAVFTNNVPVNVILTVNDDPITLNISSWLLIPFKDTDEVGVVISNPADNEILIPAKVVYVSV